MIIDFHTHSFPDTLAPKAMESLKKNCAGAGISAHTDGTAEGAKRLLRSAGIDRAAVCNIATNARQEEKVNSFAISLLSDPFFISLGSVHPDSEHIEEQLDRLLASGINGVKLHPDYVRIELTDKRYDKIFSLLEERGMFCVAHTGYDPVSPDKVHATPEMIRSVIDAHRGLKLICAHMGGFKQSEGVLRHLVGTGIYIDTSLSSIREGEYDNLIKILNEHDPSRILFGTDTPWTEPKEEVEFIKNAPIASSLKEKIFSENAKALLGI